MSWKSRKASQKRVTEEIAVMNNNSNQSRKMIKTSIKKMKHPKNQKLNLKMTELDSNNKYISSLSSHSNNNHLKNKKMKFKMKKK